MGNFSEIAIVNSVYLLPTKENELPFSIYIYIERERERERES